MSNVQFMAKAGQGEIWLYDSIGENWGGGISAKAFAKDLSGLGKVSQINVRINSPGGDVFDGIAIYNLLRNHPADISVDIDGLAASIASVIAMSAAPGNLRIAANAMMMIHDPQGMAFGSAKEMQRTAALLDQVKGTLVSTYRDRTKQDDAQLEQWMEDETWFTAEQAVEHGFADTSTAEQPVHACYDLSRFKRVPAALKRRATDMDPVFDITRVRLQDYERRLRKHVPA